MFPRFDPDAVVSRKRKLSELEESDSSSGSSDDSKSSKNSTTSSDSASDSDSDSESSKSDESDEAMESEIEAENEPEKVPEASEKESEKESEKSEKPENTENRDAEAQPDPLDDMEVDPEYASKHSAVFLRFKKAQQLPTEEQQDEPMPENTVEQQGLAPLPQPELPHDTLLTAGQIQNNLDWLATPMYGSPEKTEDLGKYDLLPKVRGNLAHMGISSAFSVQVSVFELLLEDIRRNKVAPDFRGDILVNAATGSGKTLAYVVPIVEALQNRLVPATRAVVLVPTRPLINQVLHTFKEVSKGTPLQIVSLTHDLSVREESRKIQANVPDVLVTTPGRLVEHLQLGSVNFLSLRFLIVDEADRLLNQLFQNWSNAVVTEIEKHQSPSDNIGSRWQLRPQKLIFSATLTTDAGKLALLKFEKPRLVVINSSKQLVREMFSVPATLLEHCLAFPSSLSAYKPFVLAKFLVSQEKLSHVLVFAKSNDATLRLAKVLEAVFASLNSPVSVAYMNSTNNMTSVRSRIFRDFSDGKIGVLVATDLIARGLDLTTIANVVNYDLPNSSRDYVHRVGRTARANQHGEAYSMVFGRGEEKWFKTILANVGRERDVQTVDDGWLDIQDDERRLFADVLASF